VSNKKYEYANTSYMRVGKMICTCCNKAIESGDFRYRETTDAFLPQHRECTKEDNNWCRLDNQRKAEIENTQNYLQACLEFQRKWDTCVLDDEIYELKRKLDSKFQ